MKKTIATLLALISLSAWADGQWNAGYMQGTSTYTTSVGKGYFSIECSDDERWAGPGVFFSPDGVNSMNNFEVVLDGTSFEVGFNKFQTQAAFNDFYDALLSAKQAQIVSKGKTFPLALGNVQEVVPPTDSPEYACSLPTQQVQQLEQTQKAQLTVNDFEVEFLDYRSNRGLQELPRNQLSITAKTDNVTIVGLLVNRGKCAINPGIWKRNDRFPTKLGFGDKAVYELAPTENCANVIEFAVITDQGTVGFAKQ